MTTTRKLPIVAGKKAVQDKIPGINRVTAKLSGGREAVYYYHRATGTKLPGEYGSPEFLEALAAARAGAGPRRTDGTLAGLIRAFEGTAKWRRLAESTRKEYKRIFTFWDGKFGTVPTKAIESKGFREDVLEWHDAFSADKPREADNRVTILARVLSWAASDRSLRVNVLDTFERAYSSDRSEKIWLPEHVEAFMEIASPEMHLAMMLALHTGQRQGDIRRMAWTNYDGTSIAVRQGKTGRRVLIPCTKALKAVLDGLERRGALILTTKTGKAFTPEYIKRTFAKTRDAAGVTDLHFHDIRGTTVTMLFEAGCTVAEAASITGHSLRGAQEILDRYLSRTATLATSAIIKLENRMNTERAKRSAKGYKGNSAK
jgi:integrase